jgi:uncharacterized membrane protein YgaE (UPF0421/DUF939 family)
MSRAAAGDSRDPVTAAIAVGWRARVDPVRGLRRVRDSGVAIVQIVVASTGAYAFASSVLGHPVPLLAATVTVSSLGLVRDARPRRVLETVLGMLLGILVSELLLIVAGSGWWQLALALGMTLTVARFLSPQASFAIAAAIQSLIVMVLPMTPGAPFVRLIDGIVGGVCALLVTALIPRSPRAAELRDAGTLFRDVGGAAAALGQALRRGDRMRAERGLEKARALQARVDDWRESLDSGRAIVRISPFLRRQRGELDRHARVLASMDLATRNLRVIARRVVYLCDDGKPRPIAADVLGELARATDLVGRSLHDISLEPIARETILSIAAHLDPREMMPGASLGDQNLLAAMRPLAVDLLVGTGMTQADARAAVPRI